MSNIILNQVPGNLGVEYWTSLNWNGIILDRYSITSCGRVFDHETGQFRPFRIDKDGYYICDIKLPDGQTKNIRVHRFELMSFNFIPNFRDMVVNHKDGDKTHNELYNLEWTTSIGNTRHGWDTGLNPNIGLGNPNGKYGDEIIHKICELIDIGLSNAEICTEFGITDKTERMRFNGTISGIRYGKTHRNISEGYKFRQNINIRRYDLDFAYLVCCFLSDQNRQYTYKEIMDYIQIPNEDRINFKQYIGDLIRGRTAKDVTKLYPNLRKPIDTKEELFN